MNMLKILDQRCYVVWWKNFLYNFINVGSIRDEENLISDEEILCLFFLFLLLMKVFKYLDIRNYDRWVG